MPRQSGTQSALSVTVNQPALVEASAALALQGQQAQRLMTAYNVTQTNPDALEAEIRGFQQTAVEAMFAIGTRLLVLRMLTDRGDWLNRLERLNMAPRSAQKVMQATLRYADPRKPRDKLQQLGRGKLLELLTLDDEDLAVLESGGDVMELDLDDIAAMSTSELRKKLREAEANLEAKDKLLKKRGTQIDQLQTELERTFVPDPASVAQTEQEQAQYLALQEAHVEALAVLARLAVVVRDIKAADCTEALRVAADGAVQHATQRLADIAAEHGLSIDLEEVITPAWLGVMEQPPRKKKG